MVEQIDLNSFCFLCKKPGELTEEHVFPTWMQQDYGLRNKFITLKNGSKFMYRKLKVPCCQVCNNEHLSRVEDNISRAIRSGDVDALCANSNQTFIWLYKIMYGLHYKEMFLKEDIKNPYSESIVCTTRFFEKNSYNLFPLYAIGLIEFSGFKPYSLFAFKLSEVIDGGFFYADEPYKMFSSIVLGDIGIVCSFQCDGYIENDIEKHLKVTHSNNLSPAEFGDFSAFVLHLKSRMKMLPNYLCHSEGGKVVFRNQQPKDEWKYRKFEVARQFEFTTKAFKQLFEKLIAKGPDGQLQVKYKSPFTYF